MNAPETASPFFERWGTLLQVTVLVMAVVWTFSPTLTGDWQWDDTAYLTQNSTRQDPHGLGKIWLEPANFIEYYPIEASVQWLQWQLWHEATFGYHLTNIALHLLSALLLWRLFSQLGLRFAWLGAMLFALHPTAVESVAWISELKNTLSLPPFLLAMSAWLVYDVRGQRRDYLLALAFFLVAMLCKISMILFPAVILLYAWWKRGQVGGKDLKEVAPFLVVSLALGITNAAAADHYTQFHGLANDVPLGGFLSRMACAGLTLGFYFLNCLWPVGLMPIYPHWVVNPPSLLQFLPWVAFAGIFYGCWNARAGWGRDALLGLGFFTINLLPFLGFISISYMNFTWVMDHFLYLPIIGLIGLTVAGLEVLADKLPRLFARGLIGITVVVIFVLARVSHVYAEKFSDEETLWTYVLRQQPAAWIASDNLGNVLLRKGRVVQAMKLFEQALRANPRSALVHNNLGVALEQTGQIPQALQQYREALRISPGYPDAQHNLARLEGMGNH